MKLSRNLPHPTRRDAWLTVDLDALEQNARCIRRVIPQQHAAMAVIKADAYGHGAVMTLPTLLSAGFTQFGVASADEALQIREANSNAPLLVLGPTPDWAMDLAIRQQIQLTIFDAHHLEALANCFQNAGTLMLPARVHLKIDTGMHRIGLPWQAAARFYAQACQQNGLEVIGLMTHLAAPEHTGITRQQLERWQHVLSEIQAMSLPLPSVRHISNSTGVILNAAMDDALNTNMVRIGLPLFGYGPAPAGETLRPVMGLKARVAHLQTLPFGEGVSYGHTYATTQPETRLATLPLGYADGLPRRLSGKLSAVLQGMPVAQVGLITMDQFMLDVSAVPQVQLGDTVTLLGRPEMGEPSLETWLKALNDDTIAYELMCALRVRLPRTYIRTGLL
ncbi:MAG: alanine racemase [Vampirovibrionales bacterium]|nr:alanine racemase [Vampirovibrionales bacterium]